MSTAISTPAAAHYERLQADAIDGTAVRELSPRFDSDDFFGHQGARELEQINRWVSDDVYRHLLKRVIISGRARQAKGQTVVRPSFSIGSTTVCEPRDGVVEAVVIVRGRTRARAVAIRLEGLDRRWRATAIHVL